MYFKVSMFGGVQGSHWVCNNVMYYWWVARAACSDKCASLYFPPSSPVVVPPPLCLALAVTRAWLHLHVPRPLPANYRSHSRYEHITLCCFYFACLILCLPPIFPPNCSYATAVTTWRVGFTYNWEYNKFVPQTLNIAKLQIPCCPFQI